MDLHKHTLNFYEGDVERIRDLVPDLKPSEAIREIIHAFVTQHEGIERSKVKLNVEVKL